MAAVNYVAKLNEHAQTARVTVSYEEVGSVGPDHIKTFTLRAVVNGEAFPEGVGKSKKEAKQNAAKNAVERLLGEPADSAEHTAEAPPAQVLMKTSNYTCWLNEYSQKNVVTIRPEETFRLGPVYTIHCCKFVVGGKEYPAASGRTKKEAKEEAAKLVYKEIMGSETLDTGDGKDSGTSSLHSVDVDKDVSLICDQAKNLSIQAEDRSFAETNFIGIIYQYCQKTGRSCVFTEDRRCGPSHSPTYYYKLVIGDREYPVGEGKNIKEAKQIAAKLAWSALKEQPDWDSKVVASDEGPEAKDFSPSSLKDSSRIKSSSSTPTSSDFVIFADSSPNVQVQSPDVKPRIKLAAKFQNVDDRSKERLINFKVKDKGNTQRAKAPTQLASRFTLDYDSIESLDKGSFGRVFKARHKLENKFYAVKVVCYKEKTLQEVKVLSDLNHCNIVRYHSCWIEDTAHQWDSSSDTSSASQSSTDSPAKYLYIQMELCDIRTLRLWIDEKNIQNAKKSLRDSKRKEESLSIALETISGVEYIHSQKLIHRDLKPANIMFSRNGTVKIGDFGLVTPVIEDDSENQRERRGYKGTPSYMAPEQRNGILYDLKVDIFALGLIYFELLWNIPTIDEKNKIWEDVRSQKLPLGFCQHFNEESQMIKLMLHFKPEERPEARRIKTDLEEHKRSLEAFKKMQLDSRTL
ncbi:interferon-induced, double-stranded RNA-activated protein kinase isoform X2 [Kryptolebias marmoratus]|uniref:interferon-induced, double-stranded RNA-activated protein kinase isoform X2 n=1 Tax=Kryptolebias marmoratus TaxID=37003 RepID=UPI0007F8C8F6|nr:interferon-induced, double-stranded RNA-activated protein kinase isoform X2 [Kryptolebias marmoratus]